MSTPSETVAGLRRRFRLIMVVFIVGLVVSGVTAFPLLQEMDLLISARGLSGARSATGPGGIDAWLLIVRNGLHDMYGKYPWIAYGTDWLAFAHIVIAIFFVGPLLNPVRNVWVVQAGLIACGLVIPLALICGAIRQIPFGWRLIDCSFGVFGAIPLWYCWQLIRKLERLEVSSVRP